MSQGKSAPVFSGTLIIWEVPTSNERERVMLHTLALQRFRGFESYQLTGLARVNLVVGKNNCGKTSILEAIELLRSEGHPRVLYKLLQRRNEMGTRRTYERSYTGIMDISHIFHGHVCNPGVSLDLSSDDSKCRLKVMILSRDDAEKGSYDWNQIIKESQQRMLLRNPLEDIRPVFGMIIDSGVSERRILLPVIEDKDGSLGIGYERYSDTLHKESEIPVYFLTLDSFDPASMTGMWNTILEKGLESEVASDMRLLKPDLDSIHFLTGAGMGEHILVGLRNGRRRLPIGTYGDGMKRLLALRISFIGAESGVLLIDEIDAGLHWTVMEDMWKFVIKVASRLNVQVFATTHSFDCIRGLGSLLRNSPELEDQVSLQKIDQSLPEAVCLKGDQVRIAVENDIEVR